MGLAVLVAACSREAPGTADFRRDFRGGVAGDEPRAVMVGQEMLLRGGTAADAAVAMYFAHAVTLPSSASLGGGGLCLVWDPKANKAEALFFPARNPPGASGAGGIAIPGNPRGMAVLQAKHGRMRWEQVVAPAENMARFGVPVSRALAADLAEWGQGLAADREANLVFVGTDRSPLREGTMFTQPDLARVLGTIRGAGGLAFNTGPLAESFVAGARAAGATFSVEDLAAAAPAWRETVQIRRDSFIALFGLTDFIVHVAPPPALGGLTEAQIFMMLAEGRRIRGASADERPHLFAETSLRALQDRRQWAGPGGTTRLAPADIVDRRRIEGLMAGYRPNQRSAGAGQVGGGAADTSDPHSASFAALDRAGLAVACEVTAHGPFGAGRMAAGTGIILAATAAEDGAALQALGPMLIVGTKLGPIIFAGAASGGSAAAPALATLAAQALIEQSQLEQAMDTPRVFYDGVDDAVVVEAGVGERLPGLAARGYPVRPSTRVGRVNAIFCPGGLSAETPNCQFRADRRGAGLAAAAQ